MADATLLSFCQKQVTLICWSQAGKIGLCELLVCINIRCITSSTTSVSNSERGDIF